MTTLLGIKSAIAKFYGEHEFVSNLILKFAMAFVSYLLINYFLGYNDELDRWYIALALALLSCLLPVNFTLFVGAVLIIVHTASLHWGVAAVTACLFVVIFLLFFRFSPRDGYHTQLTPVFFALKAPAIMPISAGLLRRPGSIISVGCGTVVYYYLRGICQNAALLNGSGEDASTSSIFGTTLKQLYANVDLLAVTGITVATAVLVYIIRRLSITHAWTIAIAAGAIFNLMGMLILNVVKGDLSTVPVIAIGEAVSFAVCLGLELFVFNLDYTRVERVQFEDDDYYYYVKAVPKRHVSERRMERKTFNEVD